MTMTPKEVIARQREALALRLAGATYDQIAERLGFSHGSGAFAAVKRELAARGTQQSPQVVDTELARLDAMLVGIWAAARKGDLAAIDRVLRISERRMQLLALLPEPAAIPQEGDPVDDLRRARDARRAKTAGP